MAQDSSGIRITGAVPVSPDHKLQLLGADGEVVFGEGVKLIGLTKVNFKTGGGRLLVGAGVELRGSFTIGDGSDVIIGAKTRINRHCLFIALEAAKIKIGKRCLLSNCTLRTCDMHTLVDDSGKRVNPSRSIVLEDRVWLAENTYVCKGVTMEHDSVAAANAVVAKNVPPHTVVAGNPAKPVKTGVSWLRKRVPMPEE